MQLSCGNYDFISYRLTEPSGGGSGQVSRQLQSLCVCLYLGVIGFLLASTFYLFEVFALLFWLNWKGHETTVIVHINLEPKITHSSRIIELFIAWLSCHSPSSMQMVVTEPSGWAGGGGQSSASEEGESRATLLVIRLKKLLQDVEVQAKWVGHRETCLIVALLRWVWCLFVTWII